MSSLEDELLTVAEVAERLKLNQQTIRNWIDRGELPAVRVGSRRVRVRRSDLDRFLADSAIQATTEDPLEGDARADLREALDRARNAVSTDDADLAAALRSLAEVADRLARALDDAAT